MIETLFVAFFPLVFLVLLFGGEKLFHKKGTDVGGKPPINKAVFLTSKYSIILLWACMIIQSFGLDISMIQLPAPARFVSLSLWFFGFMLLFIGRVGLGSAFRIGEPKENTSLKTTGLFSFSRNPMYVGVYATILASILYTANLFVLLAGIFIITVHHIIVLSEEKYLKQTFGKKYADYCAKVRRYI
jgi:protein-S-isoprenylcysteine O-methyltransferase Ste14